MAGKPWPETCWFDNVTKLDDADCERDEHGAVVEITEHHGCPYHMLATDPELAEKYNAVQYGLEKQWKHHKDKEATLSGYAISRDSIRFMWEAFGIEDPEDRQEAVYLASIAAQAQTEGLNFVGQAEVDDNAALKEMAKQRAREYAETRAARHAAMNADLRRKQQLLEKQRKS